MKKASNFLTEEQKQSCLETLKNAESRTSGEIVPVVASASGKYDRAEDIVGLLVALIALATAWILFQGPAQGGDWVTSQQVALGILPCIAVIVLGFIVGSALATWCPLLRLPFISSHEKTQEVERRAAECFYRYEIGRTKGATGVLIYISLFEHMVVIKADTAISSKIEQSQWDSACKAIVDGIKAGEPGVGLSNGIEKCSELLAQHFPSQAADVNELVDEIHFID